MSKIIDVKFNLKYFQYEKPFHITGSVSSETKNVEVEIVTDSGIKGIGEASPSFRVNGEKVEMLMSLENIVKDMFVGLDVKEYRKIFELTSKFFATPSLKAAVEYAVLDAFAESAGVEVYQLLGGALKKIETDRTVGIDTVENRVREAKSIFDDGFKVIKIKVGENLKEDIDAMLEIHEVTRGAKYIVDANMGYSPKQAVEFAQQLYSAGIDVAVYEQPVTATDIDGLRFVRFNNPFPVAADESARTRFDVIRLIKEEAVDYVNIKLMKSGISDALSIVELARSANLRLMIGCMSESSVGINQSVHFALGTGVFDFHDLDSHLMMKEHEFRGKFVQNGPEIKAR
ncbi:MULTISPECIES: L-Ala-D/L-Glu epimerase [Pseudothermotoga]|jgi:L-alanine-DL-glutamate epimerase-like enolase superfamily enzyme|uniref:Dipeptide epimerase n=2 Tax=Pseudothermotoga TaxID=1643951 RepID=A8F493_PSELT|nr:MULTISPECIES: L-Ala-D/L-Glu epimerase [Pseudothermotoga]ABV32977.1 Mandelate racemase/muconate lactonizing protein [Pseudothermotoga lettingae TMO]KUK21978.1 MAG: Mandelate racemase/muconate lactonizing protein [Pseudothermotoga lettingae]MDI3494243.1 L-Ala-D/L-Glu epimerase [Pseudothermotoga sp.]MDK2883983.1 L-Ala-D/L-Glu epimerase [Pseudothermotoga sp.]GLI48021.1 L-Ala-D/L-Glu epimerase [Pseudothermotoga lettingae TMO]